MEGLRTSEIAARFGLHPNTVRFYEDVGFLTPPARRASGYRVYTELHVRELRLIRLALQSEVLLGGLRKRALDILRLSAQCRFKAAIRETRAYDALLAAEIARAQTAARQVAERLSYAPAPAASPVTRRQAADALGVTAETVRNWERNGLAESRMLGGRRVFDAAAMRQLTIVRTLRAAGYSLTAILQLTNRLAESGSVSVPDALHVSDAQSDILSACDRLIVSLEGARANAAEMLRLLLSLRKEFATLQ